MPSENVIIAIIGAIAGVVAAFIARGYFRAFKPHIEVKRVVDPSIRNLDFHVAMDLYERRIDSDELASALDTQRWLEEAQEAKKKGALDIEEYFFVAIFCEEKHHSKVCGLFYFTYYPKASPAFAFISYLVTDNEIPEATSFEATAELLKATAKLFKNDLKRCKGFVTEVRDPESPDIQADAKKAKHAHGKIARFRRLSKGIVGFADLNKVPYRQPDLSPPGEPSAEVPMRLLYFPVIQEKGSNDVSFETIKEIVTFVYDKIYGDSFIENGKRNEAYEEYLFDLRDRVIEGSRVETS